MVSLASRSCHWIHRASLDPTKKNGSLAKPMVNSHKNQIAKSVSGTAKKLHDSSRLLEKKAAVVKMSAMKGRFVPRFCTYFIMFDDWYFYQFVDIDFF